MSDEPFDPLEEYTMTEAEAAALSDTAPRNRPTIPVKACPAKPRATLTKTINYKVHVKTASEAQHTIRFNVPPTADLIAEALWYEKVNVTVAATPGDLEAEKKRYDRARARFDNLIALVRLAEIKLPKVGKNETVNVMVAGVLIGHVNICCYEAWTQ